MNKDLLFEIGTEEIPSKYMPKTLEQARSLTETKLNEKRICFNNVKTLGTPRRITVIVEGIADRQEDLEEMVKGPSKKAAYDAEGNPTKALQGFLKGQKASVEDIMIQQLSGADYVYVKKYEKGQLTAEVLKTILPEVMTSITFPKSMKWGNKSFRFARPIRWVMPILGDEVVGFDKDGISCGRITKGHRVLSKGDITINNTSAYIEKLREGFVIVDQDERRELIRKQCIEIARSKGGEALIDEELLEEILYLVEYPTALIGNFEEEYLKLPKEAVITPMKEHQRYFPVVDKNGKLLNHFITVRNGGNKYLDIVAEGNEKVLRARLADAKFFFDEDKKTKLDSNVEKLKHVVFQETLGTIYNKTERIEKNADYLADIMSISAIQKENLLRAAHLSKADLITGMVKEFTELQGIMGREYALLQGENQEVADAILEQYLPRSAGAETPDTVNGALLGIADRIDTISGCFAIGIQPTGSQDPYGLRRQAIAIISIILDKSMHLSLSSLCERALDPFIQSGILKGDTGTIKKEILDFFKGRMKNALMDKGFQYDIVDAVLNSEFDDMLDAYKRVSILADWKNKEEFLNILSSFNRVSSLASKARNSDINGEILFEHQEKELVNALYSIKDIFENSIQLKNYEKALQTLMTLKAPIDNFFDNIMVMVDEEDIRNNRLAILKSIWIMMNSIADLSIIVVK